MDKDIIREFWRKRAATGATRWTGEGMLGFDQDLLRPLIRPGARMLDLGSGFGELSRSICPPDGTLLAVDQEAAMGAAFADDPRFEFETADAQKAVVPTDEFDLALLFGVVTHLTESEEDAVYSVITAALAAEGIAVVKNQCSDGEDFEVNTFSKDLDSAYVGRYPSRQKQRDRLLEHFGEVQVLPYPEQFRMHADSSHVAFICSNAR